MSEPCQASDRRAWHRGTFSATRPEALLSLRYMTILREMDAACSPRCFSARLELSVASAHPQRITGIVLSISGSATRGRRAQRCGRREAGAHDAVPARAQRASGFAACGRPRRRAGRDTTGYSTRFASYRRRRLRAWCARSIRFPSATRSPRRDSSTSADTRSASPTSAARRCCFVHLHAVPRRERVPG